MSPAPRTTSRPLAFLVAVWLVAACAPTAAPLAAEPDPQAAGTVKIHDGNSESDGNANDPKVCTFHIHFFLGKDTSGTWRIETQPGSTVVLEGDWDSGSASDVRVPPYPDTFSLPDGQYKLYWDQAGASGGSKQKVFKVACPTPTATPSATPTPSPTASPTPTPTLSPTPTATPTPTPTPAPTAAPTEGPTPTSVPTPDPSAEPTASATPTATPTPSPTPSPTPTASPTPTPTASPAPTPSPTPTATSAPSATPDPSGGVDPEETDRPSTTPDGSADPAETDRPRPPGTDTVAPTARMSDVGGALGAVLLLVAAAIGFALGYRRARHSPPTR